MLITAEKMHKINVGCDSMADTKTPEERSKNMSDKIQTFGFYSPYLLQQHGKIRHEPQDAPVPDGA